MDKEKEIITDLIKNRATFVTVGILITMLSVYWLIKSGYHLIFYDETLGYDVLTFGYGVPYYEIVLKFAFSLIIILGGIGLIKTDRIGLRFGLFAAVLSGFLSFVYALATTSHLSKYSKFIIVNQTEVKMTNLEEWEIIYSHQVYHWLLFLVIVAISWVITRRLKMIDESSTQSVTSYDPDAK